MATPRIIAYTDWETEIVDTLDFAPARRQVQLILSDWEYADFLKCNTKDMRLEFVQKKVADILDIN